MPRTSPSRADELRPPAEHDFELSAYAYNLPTERIAQYPAEERDAARLMVLDARSGASGCSAVRDLARHLPENSLLIANNSRVVPARLTALRPGGGAAEFLLLTPLPFIEARGGAENANGPPRPEGPEESMPGRNRAIVSGLVRPARRLRAGSILTMPGGLDLEIKEIGPFGQTRGELRWPGGAGVESLRSLLARHGRLPLPPYIRRPAKDHDAERYQTAFSRPGTAEGSVAAPTAGLHFTPALIAELRAAGHEWREITLHVGYGTFSPVRHSDIRRHVMHCEYYTIQEETAAALKYALSDKRPVIAVGTTAARALEGAFRGPSGLSAHSGATDIFIYPGYAFQVLSGLLTNFHLPESTLLMLASALAGRERLLRAYALAIEAGFRFFSYGDCMLILNGKNTEAA